MSTTFRFMETFAQRNGDSAKLAHEHGAAYLCIERPSTLAAFLAFCSGQSANTRIFLRGCTENYSTAYPSLFRENSNGDSQCEQRRRWHAYQHALVGIRRLNGRRWRQKDLGAILQHYGVRTPWLDVVRNLYTAIWFATHDLRETAAWRRRACANRPWLDFVLPATSRDHRREIDSEGPFRPSLLLTR